MLHQHLDVHRLVQVPIHGHQPAAAQLVDDRHGSRSTLITSQLPVEHWHEVIADPTLADAILDRIVHSAYRVQLKGESMRKHHPKLTPTIPSE